jgi:hypothetical protein
MLGSQRAAVLQVPFPRPKDMTCDRRRFDAAWIAVVHRSAVRRPGTCVSAARSAGRASGFAMTGGGRPGHPRVSFVRE